MFLSAQPSLQPQKFTFVEVEFCRPYTMSTPLFSFSNIPTCSAMDAKDPLERSDSVTDFQVFAVSDLCSGCGLILGFSDTEERVFI